MGSGDWNDGMSSVGNGGKGESVWLTWFMCDILERLIPICERRGDSKEAKSLSVTREMCIRDRYTHHAHLNSDEIWLFFDMVKLALIENIAYLCKRIRFCIKEYEYAHKYAAYVLSKRADAEQMRQKVLRYFTRCLLYTSSITLQLSLSSNSTP